MPRRHDTKIAPAALGPSGRDAHLLREAGYECSRHRIRRARTRPVLEPGRLAAGHQAGDRKSVVSGKSVSVRVDLGGRRIIKIKNQIQYYYCFFDFILLITYACVT